ncbi:hypothetical protein RCL1_006347 [Eukaryota sp. TZLM3-RCL]
MPSETMAEIPQVTISISKSVIYELQNRAANSASTWDVLTHASSVTSFLQFADVEKLKSIVTSDVHTAHVETSGWISPTAENLLAIIHASLCEIYQDADLTVKDSLPPLVFTRASNVSSTEDAIVIPLRVLRFLCCFTTVAYVRPFINSFTAHVFSVLPHLINNIPPSALVPKHFSKTFSSLQTKSERFFSVSLYDQFARFRPQLLNVHASTRARSMVAQLRTLLTSFLPVIAPNSKAFNEVESILVTCMGFTDTQAAHEALRLLNCLYDGNALQLPEPFPVTSMKVGSSFSLPSPPSRSCFAEGVRFVILLRRPTASGDFEVSLFSRSEYDSYAKVELDCPGPYDFCYLSFDSTGQLLPVTDGTTTNAFRGRIFALPLESNAISSFATLNLTQDLTNLQSSLSSLKQKGASILFVNGLLELSSNPLNESKVRSFMKVAESCGIKVIPDLSNLIETQNGMMHPKMEPHFVKNYGENFVPDSFLTSPSVALTPRQRSQSFSTPSQSKSQLISTEPLPLVIPSPLVLNNKLIPNYRSNSTWKAINDVIEGQNSQNFGLNFQGCMLPKASSWPFVLDLPREFLSYGTTMGSVSPTFPSKLRNLWELCSFNNQTWPNPLVLKIVLKIWKTNKSFLIAIDTDDCNHTLASIASGVAPISSEIATSFSTLLSSSDQVPTQFLSKVAQTSLQFVKLSGNIVNSFLSQSNQMSLVDLVTLSRNNFPCIDSLFADCLYSLRQRLKDRMQLRNDNSILSSGVLYPIEAKHSQGVHKRVASWMRVLPGATSCHDSNILANCIVVAVSLNDYGEVLFYLDTSEIVSKLKLYASDGLNDVVIAVKPLLTTREENNVLEYWDVDEFIESRHHHVLQCSQTMIVEVQLRKVSDLDRSRKVNDSIVRLRRLIVEGQDCEFNYVAKNLIDVLSENSPEILNFKILSRIRLLLTQLEDKNSSTKFEEKAALFALSLHQLIVNRTYQSPTNLDWGSKSIKKLIELSNRPPSVSSTDHYTDAAIKVINQIVDLNCPGALVFVTAELGKWSTIGGLGVMVFELTKKMADQGESVVVISPYYHYNKFHETGYLEKDGVKYLGNISINLGDASPSTLGVHGGFIGGVYYIFLHSQELFNYPYEFKDDVHKFKSCCGLAKGSLEVLSRTEFFDSKFGPKLSKQVIVTNDWMAAPLAAFAKTNKVPNFKPQKAKIFHLVHNLSTGYEGFIYPHDLNSIFRIADWLDHDIFIDPYGPSNRVSLSRSAFKFCDSFGTVSKTYLEDIKKDSNWAHQLSRFVHPVGISNGVDSIERRAQIERKIGKISHNDAKKVLQEKYFGKSEPDLLVVGFVGRFTEQKGVHLITSAAWELLSRNEPIQFIIGGMAGRDDPYGDFCARQCWELRNRFPHRFWAEPNAFFGDGQLLNLGCDVGAMCSLFEPGGIVQMEFFLVGTPVIAHSTGGLKDTVFEFNPRVDGLKKGNGFTFLGYTKDDFVQALRRASLVFKNEEEYEQLRKNAAQSVLDLHDIAIKWRSEFGRILGRVIEI